ncbi:hypothetical protein A9W35_19925, partial [Salmonella enterica subsp. arizonae serovar 18:z4,z23:-]|nr:hypothetical protein [Salmonella enterica subsp. arizonae serovar 18:z4,z23:-]
LLLLIIITLTGLICTGNFTYIEVPIFLCFNNETLILHKEILFLYDMIYIDGGAICKPFPY